MADKAISELVAASAVNSADLFVLEQGGTAKKLTGQTLENWLVHMANGHGGIQSIEKTGTSGLVDTYTITMADTTTVTFTVTNGKAIRSIATYYAVSSNDTTPPTNWSLTRQNMTVTNRYLWSHQAITFNDGSMINTTSSVIGVYGDTGAQTYVWIKYAAVRPTSNSDVGDDPDKWIGIYVGLSDTAPTSYTEYTWYEYKGEKGDTGDAATIESQSVTYLEGSSGTVVPSGSWSTTIPSVTPGNYLWTRTILTFNDGTNTTAYSVSRFGIDGTGSVSTVNGQSPNANGNIALTAGNIPASDNQSVQAHLNARRTTVEQDAIDAAQDATIGVVITGNRPSRAVTAGQYVIVRNSTISGITDGLYTANATLSPSVNVTAANLSAVPSGGLNAVRPISLGGTGASSELYARLNLETVHANYFVVGGGQTTTLTLRGAQAFFMIAAGTAATRHGLYIVSKVQSDATAPTITTIHNASGITLTAGNASITVQNNAGNAVTLICITTPIANLPTSE